MESRKSSNGKGKRIGKNSMIFRQAFLDANILDI